MWRYKILIINHIEWKEIYAYKNRWLYKDIMNVSKIITSLKTENVSFWKEKKQNKTDGKIKYSHILIILEKATIINL